MAPTRTSQPSEIMQSFLDALSPRTGPPLTVQQQLEALTETERRVIMNMAQGVQMSARLKQMTGNQQYSYLDMMNEMYGNQNAARKQLVADLLDKIAPLDYAPTGLPKQPSASERTAKLYEEWDQATKPISQPDVQSAPRSIPLTNTITNKPSEKTSNSGFMSRLAESESSGDSNAEITIKDGRRFVGSLQFGAARLADFKKHSGKRFTQDEFKADTALQDEVADWHVADIDKAIDALGDKAQGYDRDGLRSVAHLGGKGGMAKFVKSKGQYNPSDELGTSLQSYYEKFSL
jgi:hypothetical protein